MAENAIAQLLADALAHYPERPYLVAEDEAEWQNYGTMVKRIQRRRNDLSQAGIQAGDRVGISLGHPREFVTAWLTVLAMDAVAVPLDQAAPVADQVRTLNTSGARFLISDDSRFDVPPTVGCVAWESPSSGAHLVRAPLGPRLTRADQGGGVILLTSGTTGDPKPVGLPIRALLRTATEVVAAHRLTAGDVGYSPLPLFHINGEVVGVLATLLAGGSLIVSDRFHLGQFWPTVNRARPTWLNLVPSILKVLVGHDEDPQDASRIRFIRSASAPLPLAILSAIERRWNIPVIETYGLSEAASQIAANSLEGRRRGSVGKPTGVQIRIVDDVGACVGANQVGEVEIRGEAVIDPAWGPNRWAIEKLHRGWYRTGDLGRFDRDGYLYLQGRRRELINRGGEKVFPREVEEIVLEHPALADCAVVGRPHEVLGEEPVAFVVMRQAFSGDAAAVTEELGQLVAARLSRFKWPAQYFVVSALPKGTTGKVSRNSLRRSLVGIES